MKMWELRGKSYSKDRPHSKSEFKHRGRYSSDMDDFDDDNDDDEDEVESAYKEGYEQGYREARKEYRRSMK